MTAPCAVNKIRAVGGTRCLQQAWPVNVAIIAILATGVAFGAERHAPNAYPQRPLRMIVPFTPGGGADAIARIVSLYLTDSLQQAVVVDNRSGAGGVIGADLAAKAPADGYTLLFGSPGPLTVNPNLQLKIPYHPLRDFRALTQVSSSPLVLVLNPSVPAASVKGFIALAKAKPGTLNFGSAGNGSIEHLGAELFKALAGVDLVHIPYKGTGPALTDLFGGRIQLLFENLPPVLPHIRAGKLNAIAVGSAARSTFLPDLPTIAEAGVVGYEASSWFGLLVPAQTPASIIALLNQKITAVIKSAAVRERFSLLGAEPAATTPKEFEHHLKAKLEEVARLVKLAGIKAE